LSLFYLKVFTTGKGGEVVTVKGEVETQEKKIACAAEERSDGLGATAYTHFFASAASISAPISKQHIHQQAKREDLRALCNGVVGVRHHRVWHHAETFTMKSQEPM
jgi:hypothetical protein